MNSKALSILAEGTIIPAHPLALTAKRRLDERRQRALSRYYLAAGAGGLAIGVHTTQFAIRDPRHGLFEPVLTLGIEEIRRAERPVIAIAGICGPRTQACAEAAQARSLGYDAGLLSLAALSSASIDELIEHCRAVAETLPIIGFYLQPAVGGRVLPYLFWRRFLEIPGVVAIKVAPFNRYQTLDVLRAVADSGRTDVALYTGNDDNILLDLITPYRFGRQCQRFVGGLLGHWAVWTERAAVYYAEAKAMAKGDCALSQDLLSLNHAITDANAAFFDAANGFHGCIAGLHEVLRRQGLLEGIWCLDPNEGLSPGQQEEIDRVYDAYPTLNDDAFVQEHCAEWLSG